MENENFDAFAAEIKETEILLNKGMVFEAGGKKYLIKQPFLGTLDYLSAEYLKLDINIPVLDSQEFKDIYEEQKRSIHPNVKTAARIVAIAVLNSKWKIKFLTSWYARLFLWSITPADLFKLANIVMRASNLRDFTSSIALMSINRTTAPQAIED